mmetsp:Transcript_1661/g.2704  ORF Transcript_1661/g.2704 Transcript_1661/m.2704 type:complete len:209 (-) Transcript_1661:372-998(-)
MATTHTHRLEAATEILLMAASFIYSFCKIGATIFNSDSSMSSLLNSSNSRLNLSTFAIIDTARFQVWFLFSFSFKMSTALVTSRIFASGVFSAFNSVNDDLVRQSTAFLAEFSAGIAFFNVSSHSALIPLARSSTTDAFCFSSIATAFSASTLMRSLPHFSINAFAATFFSSTISSFLIRSSFNDDTSLAVFCKVAIPLSRRWICSYK